MPAAAINPRPTTAQNLSLLMKLPGSAPMPWRIQTRPTSAAIAARTKRVRSEREERLFVTGVGCIARREDALDRRR